MTDRKRPADQRRVASVLEFMARAAEAKAARQCSTPGCRRLTVRGTCDRCADDELPPPPEAAWKRCTKSGCRRLTRRGRCDRHRAEPGARLGDLLTTENQNDQPRDRRTDAG